MKLHWHYELNFIYQERSAVGERERDEKGAGELLDDIKDCNFNWEQGMVINILITVS